MNKSEHDNDQMEVTEAAPAAAPASKPRIPHKNLRLVRGLNAFAHVFDTRFDQEDLELLLGHDGDALQACRHRIVEAVAAAIRNESSPVVGAIKFTHCPRCNMALEPPDLDVQINNFKMWQRQMSTYYYWPESEMTRLRESLEVGDVLEPCAAWSVRVRRPDGRVWLFERKK